MANAQTSNPDPDLQLLKPGETLDDAAPNESSMLKPGETLDQPTSPDNPFAQYGGVHIDTNNMLAPMPTTAEQLRRDPGMPLRNKIREIENYTQEGRQIHPILARIGDYLRNVYVPGGESPSSEPLPDNWTQLSPADRSDWIAKHPPLAQPVPPPLPGISGALEAAAGESTAAAAARAASPAAELEQPGFVKQVVKGKAVAQKPAQTVIRKAVGEAAGEESIANNALQKPLLEGKNTIFDEQLSNLEQQEKDAYNLQDTTAGTDVKALRQKLSNTEYKIGQLGNTEEDIAMEAKLEKSRTGLQDQIAEAEQKLKAAGVNPRTADALHQQRMATEDLQKSFVNRMSADGKTIDVDGFANDLKKMRTSDKYGEDRLAQVFKGDTAAADKFQQQIVAAQKMGAHALDVRHFAEWVVGGLAGAAELANIGTRILESRKSTNGH